MPVNVTKNIGDDIYFQDMINIIGADMNTQIYMHIAEEALMAKVTFLPSNPSPLKSNSSTIKWKKASRSTAVRSPAKCK